MISSVARIEAWPQLLTWLYDDFFLKPKEDKRLLFGLILFSRLMYECAHHIKEGIHGRADDILEILMKLMGQDVNLGLKTEMARACILSMFQVGMKVSILKNAALSNSPNTNTNRLDAIQGYDQAKFFKKVMPKGYFAE
ncbi:unnamed protein product [Prunus brigantina]